jgi:hypothetical protein
LTGRGKPNVLSEVLWKFSELALPSLVIIESTELVLRVDRHVWGGSQISKLPKKIRKRKEGLRKYALLNGLLALLLHSTRLLNLLKPTIDEVHIERETLSHVSNNQLHPRITVENAVGDQTRHMLRHITPND